MSRYIAEGEDQLRGHLAQDRDRMRQASANSRKRRNARAEAHKVVMQEERLYELEDEVDNLRDQLNRSRALNRMVMINNKGLVQTIRHLKRSWNPTDPKEEPYKKKINPLIDKKVEDICRDPESIRLIDEDIKAHTGPEKRPRKPKR